MENNYQPPHSVAIWLRWEIHEKKVNGQLSGRPVDYRDITGVLHCKSKEEALEIIEGIINNLKEDIKKCDHQLQLETQKISNQQE